MKLSAGDPLDIVDAPAVLTAAGQSLDMTLLLRLTSQFGRDASSTLENLLAQQGNS